MPIRYKKYSSAQIFKTSLAFLAYRRFEARRAVVCCSLSSYKERKLPGRSSTGRALHAFHSNSRCNISVSEARKERKISTFPVEKSWHFYLSLSLLPSFFLIFVQCFWSWEFTGPHFRGKRFGELKTYGIRRKEVQVVSGGFSSPFSAQLYIFFVFLSNLLDLIVLAFYFILILIFIILPHRINTK